MKRVIKRVFLNQIKNIPTGFTKHYVNGHNAPTPSILQIEIFKDIAENKDCMYLIYYDSEMKEITDTYHESLEDAMKQAKLEFNVNESDWENISS